MAGVAGCQIDNPLGLVQASPPTARAPQEQPLPVLPGSAEAAAGPVKAAAAASRPPEHTASLDIDPDSLIGLDRRGVRTLLGQPSFVRSEKPTELWRYRHGSCALVLFLYAGKGGGADSFRVRHVESWAPGGAETPPWECVNALARRARRQPAG